ncbi:hypothetical protein HK414_11260 [Ramlibacter terrae]|uniref:Uncharacterized protein n=1 Tax=Ramlibacter terrae TaxID=2732511 RepID=A0ABX6P270_9BURK|nr:hypothetical protein HK414_11260 [Ramlibacter terrae]
MKPASGGATSSIGGKGTVPWRRTGMSTPRAACRPARSASPHTGHAASLASACAPHLSQPVIAPLLHRVSF